ncbi:unnamed protein product [Pleuronectes platessa]|uniref:B30.2/SPRY domain-containing protein n=1 Tax=Pleuronectes platessa TaxID=8262 RepID=A0A9N7VYR3_PLEPL|nr:unnamed protein product [Pleuronectes platessa]
MEDRAGDASPPLEPAQGRQVPPSNDTPPRDEPQTREDLLLYYRHLSLDPNTAYRELLLSESNRKVLCTEGLSGRCYWEVEFEGSVEVAVAYKGLGRSDYYHECAFGCNDKSWSLDLNVNSECFRHNDQETSVPESRSSTVGVYLDYEAGSLTHYCVCDTTLQLMHRVETTFTEPLYPGLWVAGSARLCDLE